VDFTTPGEVSTAPQKTGVAISYIAFVEVTHITYAMYLCHCNGCTSTKIVPHEDKPQYVKVQGDVNHPLIVEGDKIAPTFGWNGLGADLPGIGIYHILLDTESPKGTDVNIVDWYRNNAKRLIKPWPAYTPPKTIPCP
jgi:hypothetical protein